MIKQLDTIEKNRLVKIYAIPPSGAGKSYFAPLKILATAEEFELIPVQPPGRETRLGEPLVTQMKELVDDLLSQIQSLNTGDEFVLLGHSMGGAVTYELLAVLPDSMRVLCRGAVITGCSAPGLGLSSVAKSEASDEELRQVLRRLGGTPDVLLENESFMNMFLRILRADFAVCESADVLDPCTVDYPLIVVGARDDVDVPESHLEAWAKHTSSACFVSTLHEGGHHFIRDQENFISIMGMIRQNLL